MQAPPFQPPRLHWIPFKLSWLIAVGLVLLAALPHQIPSQGRRLLRSPIGAIGFLAISAWVLYRKPVLGIAMILLLAGIWSLPDKESFVNQQILNKDVVQPMKQKRHRWFGEAALFEEPEMIQERTEEPAFLVDEVSHEDRWYEEQVLDEYPIAIQERPIRDTLMDSSESTSTHHH
jgi:hypothetical protein